MYLASADAGAILDFLADTHEVSPEDPYPSELLARMTGLISGDAVSYAELDVDARRILGGATYGPEVEEYPDDEARYWSAASPCPITEYRMRTRDGSAVRMSDLISWRRYRDTSMYSDYFHPLRVERLLDMAMSTEPRHHRFIVVFRGSDTLDFADRDRAILEALRPHLQAREARAELLRRLEDEVGSGRDNDPPHPLSPLSPREREIVFLASTGKTNAQIAAELWLSPATIKKHLENVYQKLEVGSRAAAVSKVQGGRGAG